MFRAKTDIVAIYFWAFGDSVTKLWADLWHQIIIHSEHNLVTEVSKIL